MAAPYIRWSIKMAETKLQHARGETYAKLQYLIANAEDADKAAMAMPLHKINGDDPTWIAAMEMVDAASLALADFAGPLRGED